MSALGRQTRVMHGMRAISEEFKCRLKFPFLLYHLNSPGRILLDGVEAFKNRLLRAYTF